MCNREFLSHFPAQGKRLFAGAQVRGLCRASPPGTGGRLSVRRFGRRRRAAGELPGPSGRSSQRKRAGRAAPKRSGRTFRQKDRGRGRGLRPSLRRGKRTGGRGTFRNGPGGMRERRRKATVPALAFPEKKKGGGAFRKASGERAAGTRAAFHREGVAEEHGRPGRFFRDVRKRSGEGF